MWLTSSTEKIATMLLSYNALRNSGLVARSAIYDVWPGCTVPSEHIKESESMIVKCSSGPVSFTEARQQAGVLSFATHASYVVQPRQLKDVMAPLVRLRFLPRETALKISLESLGQISELGLASLPKSGQEV